MTNGLIAGKGGRRGDLRNATVNSSISHEEAWHEVLKPSECVRDGGYLVFSDSNANTVPSGYSGADIAEYGQPSTSTAIIASRASRRTAR